MFRSPVSLSIILALIAQLSAVAGVYTPSCGEEDGSTAAADDLSNVTHPGARENIIVTVHVATNAASTEVHPNGVSPDEYQVLQPVWA